MKENKRPRNAVEIQNLLLGDAIKMSAECFDRISAHMDQYEKHQHSLERLLASQREFSEAILEALQEIRQAVKTE